MAILNKIEDFKMLIREATGYVLYRLSSQCVHMDNGKSLEEAYTPLENLGKYYTAYGSAPSVLYQYNYPVKLTIPKGIYLVLASHDLSDGGTSTMCCGFGYDTSAHTIVAGNQTVRTTSVAGGGCSTWVILNCTGQTTIKTVGYGYENKAYNYRGTITAIRLQ